MMQHNRSLEHMKSKSEAVSAGVDPLQQPGEPDGDEQGNEDGAMIAQEHGPASEVHMMHDHEGGMHSVHSLHPDGHEHHSEHGSAEEAHEHGKKLAGGGMEQHHEPEGDEPEYD